MRSRIVVDRASCSGYGSCVDLAPDVFAMGDDLVVVALLDEISADRVRAAVRSCPMGALRLEPVAEDHS